MGDRLVRWGLPRAANAVPYLMEFIAVAVATVLITRFILAMLGFPQLGGNGLHVAHVLWGGLLMALGVMLLLSFNGTTVRPAGAFVAGIGFGLFIDEIGKFLTSDNDYFFSPAVAIIYVVIVLLVLAVQWVHGRRPLSHGELYVAALQTAASGVGTGLNARDRDLALRRLDTARDLPGAAEAEALLRALPAGRGDQYARVGTRATRRFSAVLGNKWAIRISVVVLVIQTVLTLLLLAILVLAYSLKAAGADVTMELDHPVTTVASTCTAAVSGVCVLIGLRLRKRNRYAAFRWMQRAVLIDLLLTRVLVFISNQFAAVPSLIIDLLLLATLELAIRDAAADQAAPDETVDVPVLDDSIVDGHRADVARPA